MIQYDKASTQHTINRIILILSLSLSTASHPMKCSKPLEKKRTITTLHQCAINRILQPPCAANTYKAIMPEQLVTKKVPEILWEDIENQAYQMLSNLLQVKKCSPLLTTDTRKKIEQALSFTPLQDQNGVSVLQQLIYYWPCAEKKETFIQCIACIKKNRYAPMLTPSYYEEALNYALHRYISMQDSECIADIAQIILDARMQMSSEPLNDKLFDTILKESYLDQEKGPRITAFIETLLQSNKLTQSAKNLLLEKSFRKVQRGNDVYEPLIRSLVKSGAQSFGWSQAHIDRLHQITARS